MDDLRVLAGFLDVDEAVVIRMRHEPEPHAVRLLVSLGCGWIVDEHADRCAQRCGRKECAVSAQRVFEPNWIDYRHSLVQVLKRVEADDETLEICPHCECEIDVTPAPHRPNCRGLGAGRASSATSNVAPASETRRKVVERPKTHVQVPVASLEEAGAERLGPDGSASSSDDEPELEHDDDDGDVDVDEVVLGEEAAVGDLAVSGAAASLLAGEPERAATSPSTTNPYGLKKFGRGYVWTKEAAIAAVRDYAGSVGRPPRKQDAREEPAGTLPSDKSAEQLFGSWEAMILEVGLTPVSTQSTPEPHERSDRGVTKAWTPEEIVAAIQRWNSEHGAPPTANGWTPRIVGYPSTATCSRIFGSWAATIEAAGFPRPRRGGMTVQPVPEPPKWIKVKDTGLAYRTSDEAYVAESARFDGNDAKAEQAVDASRELAEKIRAAARAADERAGIAPAPGAATEAEREPQAEPGPVEAPVAALPAKAGKAPSRSGGADLEVSEAPPGSAQEWIVRLHAEAVRLDRRAAAFRTLIEGLNELDETAA